MIEKLSTSQVALSREQQFLRPLRMRRSGRIRHMFSGHGHSTTACLWHCWRQRDNRVSFLSPPWLHWASGRCIQPRQPGCKKRPKPGFRALLFL